MKNVKPRRGKGAWHFRSARRLAMAILILATVLVSACGAQTAAVEPGPTPLPPTATAAPEPTTVPASTLIQALSDQSLLEYVQGLTAIQPYSGWRSPGSEGEREALDYVAAVLDSFANLKAMGLTIEREEFNIPVATEIWETALDISVQGKTCHIPADGLLGMINVPELAKNFDSDGQSGDTERNPLSASGPVFVIDSREALIALAPAAPEDPEAPETSEESEPPRDLAEVKGKIVFIDYAALDPFTVYEAEEMESIFNACQALVTNQAAGVVLVTRFSTEIGQSHGTLAQSYTPFHLIEKEFSVPILLARVEDFEEAGLKNWKDMPDIEEARMSVDADVLGPARSANLAAVVPGRDETAALILGAHIDSVDNPGALNDASGAAILLEIARIFDQASFQPQISIYLVWFGSKEPGLYGSYQFISTHQELMDRALAMIQLDSLTRPLDELPGRIDLLSRSYFYFGEDSLPLADYVLNIAAHRDIQAGTYDAHEAVTDNAGFSGYNVPNVQMVYLDVAKAEEAVESRDYAGSYYSPYDTVTLVEEQMESFHQMAELTLAAVLDLAETRRELRRYILPGKKAVFVGSQTEDPHMTPAGFPYLGQALALKDFDVHLIPYGTPVRDEDLADADLVVALPVVDYTSEEGSYDAGWSEEEIDVLVRYAERGGFLVLTNSFHRLINENAIQEENEDWPDVNDLAKRFGVDYQGQVIAAASDEIDTEQHPAMTGQMYMELAVGNTLYFTMTLGTVLVRARGKPAVGLVPYERQGGEVLVLGDLGMLSSSAYPANDDFWLSLADYVRRRGEQ